MAGLLTYFLFAGLHIPQGTLTNEGQKAILKLTAAGTVKDFHLIPF